MLCQTARMNDELFIRKYQEKAIEEPRYSQVIRKYFISNQVSTEKTS